MVYANPIEEELATGEFYDRLGQPFYMRPEKLESDYSPVRFARELAILRKFCPEGDVLDVGCSTGSFLHHLGKGTGDLRTGPSNRYRTFGTDVTHAALEHAKKMGVTTIEGSFTEHDFKDQQFDAITFWAVMEHLAEPKLFLTKAESLLKPGGHLFILVPNLRSLAVRLTGAKYRYIMPDHVNYFTPSTLRAFTTTSGCMTSVHQTTTHFNPIVILKDLRGGQQRVSDTERANLLKQTTRWKESPLSKPLNGAYKACEKILARLNLADNLVIVLRKD